MNLKERDPILAEISGKLDVLIRLQALGLLRDAKTRKDQVSILSDAGIGPKAIAGIIGTTENTVNVTLHSLRKERTARQTKEETATQYEVAKGQTLESVSVNDKSASA